MSNDAELRAREVTQADRDAAAALYALSSYDPVIPSMMRRGEADDQPFVQAFARHRLAASERSHDGEWEAMRGALEAILKVRVEGWENIWAGSNRCQAIARAALDRPAQQGER